MVAAMANRVEHFLIDGLAFKISRGAFPRHLVMKRKGVGIAGKMKSGSYKTKSCRGGKGRGCSFFITSFIFFCLFSFFKKQK